MTNAQRRYLHIPANPSPARRAAWEKYLAGNSWRCDKSPSGAHYWRFVEKTKHGYRCEYCQKNREFPD